MSTIWAGGRYDAVGDRIAGVATDVVATAARRAELRGAAVVDLGCGTGSAALTAADHGARVTGVDVTAELLAQAETRRGDRDITWVVADAANTGLAGSAFDTVVSNMGIIFVDPDRQVTEIVRLLKPGGVLSFSSWVRQTVNPLYDPLIAVFGGPPATAFKPDQWGDPAVAQARLSGGFEQIEIENHSLAWEFDSLAAAMDFVTGESPMHVAAFAGAGPQREALHSAFETALATHVGDGGAVVFEAPYVVISAIATGQRGGGVR